MWDIIKSFFAETPRETLINRVFHEEGVAAEDLRSSAEPQGVTVLVVDKSPVRFEIVCLLEVT